MPPRRRLAPGYRTLPAGCAVRVAGELDASYDFETPPST